MRVLIAVLFALLTAWPAGAETWHDADLGGGIRKGVATHGQIWLLGSSGKVVRFDRVSAVREVVAEGAVDLLSHDGRLWVLLKAEDDASYHLRDLRSAGPIPASSIARHLRLYLHNSEHGEVSGILVWPGQDRPALLTGRTVVTPTPDGWRRWPLAATLAAGGRFATPDGLSVYVGFNHGEWGGGLRRVDVTSGTVSFVTEASDELCGGQINPACDPVVGVFADQARPGCVIIGAGISHMGLSRGDVYRVCGSAIAPIFSTPAPAEKDKWMLAPQPWPLHGLFETPGGWVGVSRDRYFRSIDGRVAEHPMPTFNSWAGLKISDEQDGVLFLVSACCWGSADHPTLYSTIVLPVLP